MSARAAAAAMAMLLAIAGCTTTEADEEQVDALVTTTTAATDGSEAPTTTTTGPSADCPPPGAGGLPAEGQDLSEALGDFDGNGSVDQQFMYSSRSGWHMRIVLSSGFGVDVEVDARGAQAVGGFPLGEGGDVAFAIVGSGASAEQVGLFVFRDCQIVPVTGADGEHAVFPVGGSVGEGHGLECRQDGSLVAMTARSRDGRTYTTEQTVHRVDGTRLVEVDHVEGTTLDKRTADALVRLHYSLTCGTLGLGPGR